jgi:ABC-type glycerol-3-phosphate transport system permease component
MEQTFTRSQIRRKERRFEWASRDKNEKITLIIMFVVFLIYAFSLLYPVVWVGYNSLKSGRGFNEDHFGWPVEQMWSNYVDAWNADVKGVTILEAFWNSVWMTLLSVTLTMIASCLTAYVVAKYKFKGSKFIYAAAVFIQIIPLVGSISGFYQWVWSDLQIADDPFLIWPMWFGGFGFSFLILVGAFKSVPWDYAESGFIDGASDFRVFVQIMLPMVKPVLASLFIVNSISAWGEYMTSYLYMPSYPTLALAVYELSTEATRVGVPLYFAIIIISMIPSVLLFTIFQKMIMENTTAGGLKG